MSLNLDAVSLNRFMYYMPVFMYAFRFYLDFEILKSPEMLIWAKHLKWENLPHPFLKSYYSTQIVKYS